MNSTPTRDALVRAGRRVGFHLIQATIEGLKAVEAVIEEIGGIGDHGDNGDEDTTARGVQRIDIE